MSTGKRRKGKNKADPEPEEAALSMSPVSYDSEAEFEEVQQTVEKSLSHDYLTWLRRVIRVQAEDVLKAHKEKSNSVINQLRKDIQSIEGKVVDMSNKIDDLQQNDARQKRKIEQLQQENAEIRSRLRVFEIKADATEQNRYEKNLQVVGFPESKDNNDIKQFIKLGKEKLGVKIKASDINQITRLGKRKDTGSPRNVLISFHDKATKEKICVHKKKLASHKDPKRNIYLNDHLTKHRQHLLYAARQLVKSKRLFAAWCQNGNVLVRKTESGKITQVSDHNDLMKIKEEDMDTMKSRGYNSKTEDDSSTVISHLSDYDFELYSSDY